MVKASERQANNQVGTEAVGEEKRIPSHQSNFPQQGTPSRCTLPLHF